MTPADHIAAAFSSAKSENPTLFPKWVFASMRMGGLLPQSTVSVSIQRLGEIDLLCRAFEADLGIRRGAPEQIDSRVHYSMLYGELWAGLAYAISFAFTDRRLLGDNEPFCDLAADLRLLRVQLEKYQIASDVSLKEPLPMVHREPSGETLSENLIWYDPADRTRSHIHTRAFSNRNSPMWQLIDLKSNTIRWLELRELADRTLEIFTTV